MTQATFLRVLSDEDKGLALQEAVNQANNTGGDKTFVVNPNSFHQVPGSPFAYWVSDRIRRLFVDLPPFEGEGRTVKVGLQTGDDFRFVRAWWEVPPEKILDAQNGPDWREDVKEFQDWCRNRTTHGKKWVPFAKGGKFSPFYSDIHLVINWENNGDELCSFKGSVIRNPNYYFRPGITWPMRASRFTPWPLRAGCIFSHNGYSIFFDDNEEIFQNICLLSSIIWDYLFRLTAERFAHPKYLVGLAKIIPWPGNSGSNAQLGKLCCREGMKFFQSDETSPDFLNPLRFKKDDWIKNISGLYSECDKSGSAEYRFGNGDIKEIKEFYELRFGKNRFSISRSIPAGVQYTLSYILGLLFERFSILSNLEPLEPIEPVFPIQSSLNTKNEINETKDESEAQNSYEYRDAILVDDKGHNADIVTCMLEKIKALPGTYDIENEVCREFKTGSLREYLRKNSNNGFWPFHIQHYSKNSRKAPIYWQLSIPSSKYSVWLYYHRFNEDTLYKVLTEYVVPKVQSEERKLEMLQREFGPKPTASQSNEISEQESFVNELRWMREELEMVAPLWNPNLDDGVELNFAPLWRLVPQNKSCQKHIKTRWDELCSGKYDWSYIAMRLWPQRAVHASISDRSYAIAHGLEDYLWIQEDSGWKPRDVSSDEVERMISDRSLKPVQDALEKLLSAPAPLRRGKEPVSNKR